MTHDIRDLLVRARVQLMLGHPYLATAIVSLPFVDATDCGMKFVMATDGYHIFYHRELLAERSAEDIPFIIAHEVLHCVLGHLDRLGKRDKTAWNYAIDYATNALLVEFGFDPPTDVLYHVQYHGRTAEEIYEELLKAEKAMPGKAFEALGGCPSNETLDRCTSVPESVRARIRSGPLGESLKARGIKRGVLDAHYPESDPEGARLPRQELPSKIERQRVRGYLSGELRKKFQGNAPGALADEIAAAESNQVPWQELLAQFVSSLRLSDYRLYPFNRKHLWRGIYLPALGVPGPQHLVVAVDTSGSMSDEEISQVLGEIDVLRSGFDCRLTLIQCDADIQKIEDFDSFESPCFTRAGGGKSWGIKGRGGTDFRPVFCWLQAQSSKGVEPDGLIYCTDGLGTYPAAPPAIPTTWILSGDASVAVPFGTSLRIHDVD